MQVESISIRLQVNEFQIILKLQATTFFLPSFPFLSLHTMYKKIMSSARYKLAHRSTVQHSLLFYADNIVSLSLLGNVQEAPSQMGAPATSTATSASNHNNGSNGTETTTNRKFSPEKNNSTESSNDETKTSGSRRSLNTPTSKNDTTTATMTVNGRLDINIKDKRAFRERNYHWKCEWRGRKSNLNTSFWCLYNRFDWIVNDVDFRYWEMSSLMNLDCYAEICVQ